MKARCYCGAQSLRAGDALSVVYCHCSDCKRWTGAPAPAFAAFRDEDVTLPAAPSRSFVAGVARWCCPECGSPLAARFDYLPGQTFVPSEHVEFNWIQTRCLSPAARTRV